MIRIVLMLTSLLLLSACSGSNSESSESVTDTKQESCTSNGESSLGCWVTEQCGQMSDENDQLIDLWGNIKLTLEDDGVFQLTGQQYNNSTCSGEISGTTSFDDAPVYYEIGSDEFDESGVLATQIKVTPESPDNELFWVDGLFHISNESRLCFSEDIQIRHDGLRLSPSGVAIDFVNCLIKQEQI